MSEKLRYVVYSRTSEDAPWVHYHASCNLDTIKRFARNLVLIHGAEAAKITVRRISEKTFSITRRDDLEDHNDQQQKIMALGKKFYQRTKVLVSARHVFTD